MHGKGNSLQNVSEIIPFNVRFGQTEVSVPRVFYKTSFDSKQPKLEPKLVSILSETGHLFRLFRFNIATACFGVSVEPKQ
jgi:hypothetical protein